MNAHCRLKRDCPRWSPLPTEALVAKYGGRAPRYTSYPTAPHFNANVGEGLYRTWLAAIDRDAPVSLYLHVPFCERLCWYCGCNTSVVHRRAPVADYVEHLAREIALVGEAIGGPASASAIHFGGGTPNGVAPADLDRLFRALRERFNFAIDTEIAMEIDPRVLTSGWIAAAARNGLTRASLGVQDLDPAVQAAINRHQPWIVTERAIRALRNAGVASICLDLMYGLPRQTVDTIRDTVDQVLEAAPDRIALFGYAHVPWMKPSQKLIADDSLPGPLDRFHQQAAAAQRLDRAGYVRIGLDHFARRDDPMALALEAGTMRRNFQGYTTDRAPVLLGFGASAIGRLPAGYAQNAARTPDWRSAIAQGRLPVARGIVFSEEDRVRGAIIERLMCDLSVDLKRIAARPDQPTSAFAEELRALSNMEADGLVVVSHGQLSVTDAGRPFVRSISAVFDRYLDEGQTRHSHAV